MEPRVPLEVTQLRKSSVEVYLTKVVGKGSFSTTYEARCGELPCVGRCSDVIDKATVLDVEIDLQLLSAIRHPNIVQCLGTVREGHTGRPIVLLEKMDENLHNFLKRHPLKKLRVPYYVRVNILHDISMGLSYIHCNGFVHGNLTDHNILIAGETRAKISDFWIVKINMHYSKNSTIGRIDPQKKFYMAPENLSPQPSFLKKGDSYSFGVLALQVDSQSTQKIFDEKAHQSRERYQMMISKVKPSSCFLNLAQKCLASDPSERSSMEKLCHDLALLKSDDSYTGNKEFSQGAILKLKEKLLELNGVLKDCNVKLQQKREEVTALRKVIEEKEREILDEKEDNKRLKKENEMHEEFQKHLLKLQTDRPAIQKYSSYIFQQGIEELDSTPAPSKDESIHEVLLDSTTEAIDGVPEGCIQETETCDEVFLDRSMRPIKIQVAGNVLDNSKDRTLYRGYWNDQPVIVTKFHIPSTLSKSERWKMSVKLELQHLCSLLHPCIVTLYGSVLDTGNVSVVMEYLPHTLYQAVFFEKKNFSKQHKLMLMKQISEGVQFLHDNNVIIHSISSKTIHLSAYNTAKIEGFGSKTLAHDGKSLPEIINESYTAPEVFEVASSSLTHEQSKKADVYSMAVVMFELFEGNKAYKELPSEVRKRITKQPLYIQHLKIPKPVLDNIIRCWDCNIDKRPKASVFLECTIAS